MKGVGVPKSAPQRGVVRQRSSLKPHISEQKHASPAFVKEALSPAIAAESEREQLLKTLRDEMRSNEELRLYVAVLEQQLGAKHRSEQMGGSPDNHAVENARLTHQLSLKEQLVQSLQERLKNLQESLRQAEHQAAQEEAVIRQQMGRIQLAHDERLARTQQLEQQLGLMRGEIRMREDAAKAEEEKLRREQAASAELQRRVDELVSALESAVEGQQSAQARAESIASELEGYRLHESKLTELISLQTAQLQQLMSGREQIRVRMEELSRQATDSQAVATAAERERDERVAQVAAEAQARVQGALAELEESQSTARAELELLRSQLAEKSEAVLNLQSQLKDYGQNKIENIELLRKASSLESNVAALQSTNEELQRELDFKTTAVKQLQTEAGKRIGDLEARVRTQQITIAELESRLAASEGQSNRLNTEQLQQALAQSQELGTLVVRLKAQLEEAHESARAAQARTSVMQSAQDELQAEASRWKRETERLRTLLSGYEVIRQSRERPAGVSAPAEPVPVPTAANPAPAPAPAATSSSAAVPSSPLTSAFSVPLSPVVAPPGAVAPSPVRLDDDAFFQSRSASPPAAAAKQQGQTQIQADSAAAAAILLATPEPKPRLTAQGPSTPAGAGAGAGAGASASAGAAALSAVAAAVRLSKGPLVPREKPSPSFFPRSLVRSSATPASSSRSDLEQ